AARSRTEPGPILIRDWAAVTTPVFGSSAGGRYRDAERIAGPLKDGAKRFRAVLPNGRIVEPAGVSVQVGMNPLGAALTPDGKYLVTSNDDERDEELASLRDPANRGGYSLSVVETATMKVVSRVNAAGPLFIGMQVTGAGPYTVWASGVAANNIKLFSISPG